MKLYTLRINLVEMYGVAESEEDMYNKRAKVDPSFDFLPITIEEVQIPGYEIEVKTVEEEKPKRRK
jgi:hypothetical protein